MILKTMISIFKAYLFYLIIIPNFCTAQQENIPGNRFRKDQYILDEDQKLQIVVHIWGEVNRPGQYLVPDGTNVLELISLAGGPTEFSNLNDVKLTRENFDLNSDKPTAKLQQSNLIFKELIKIDLQKYLGEKKSKRIPILQPGDVIKINRNYWSKWQTLIRVVSQIAIVIQAIYFYSRIE